MLEVENNYSIKENFEDYLIEHEQNIHADKLQHVGDFIEAAMERLNNGVKIFGDPMPWNKTQDKFRFRPGEVTMWVGSSGSGKSLVCGQCALTLAQISTVGIASFEMPPDSTVSRLIRQATGGPKPTPEAGKRFAESLSMYIYNHVGNLKTEIVYGMIHYMAVEKNIKHVFIDSLVKCGVNSEKNEPQKQFLNKIQAIAKEHNIHIHIVHHTRKTQHETDVPDKYSVKGAGELIDLTDNLILVYRNKYKEKQKKEKIEVDEETPDSYLDIAKQRHGEWEGLFGFWWHEQTTQWIDNTNGIAHRYIA